MAPVPRFARPIRALALCDQIATNVEIDGVFCTGPMCPEHAFGYLILSLSVRGLPMRRLSIAIIAAASTVAFSQIAAAADMPVKAPPYSAPVAVYNWSGFYVGGNVGYGWGGSTGNDIALTDPNGEFFGSDAIGLFRFPSLKPKGVIGGPQIGYNFQSGPVVWGLIADFQFSDMKDDQTVAVPALPIPGDGTEDPENQSHSAKIDWFGTVRGRVGYAFNNILPYISGGLAYGRVESTLSLLDTISGLLVSGSHHSTRVGWTIGGGVEYGLTSNWTIGVDYIYFDLGHDTVTATQQNFPPLNAAIAMDQHFTGNVVRALVNYKF
jgi:outer membrane immunogenic protein